MRSTGNGRTSRLWEHKIHSGRLDDLTATGNSRPVGQERVQGLVRRACPWATRCEMRQQVTHGVHGLRGSWEAPIAHKRFVWEEGIDGGMVRD